MATYGDIENWQALVDELVPELADLVELIAEAISPNGERWGMEKKTEHEMMMDYMENLRGNQDAWLNWIRQRVQGIQESLTGIDQKLALSVHPYNIAEAHAFAYSAKMERLWKKEIEAAVKAAPRESPAVPMSPQLSDGVILNAGQRRN